MTKMAIHVMKQWYDVTEKDMDAILSATTWNAADYGYFRGGGFSSSFVTEAEMPCHHDSSEPGKGTWPGYCRLRKAGL